MKLILAAVFALVATAAFAGDGRYAISTGEDWREKPVVWVLDTKSGELRYCILLEVRRLHNDNGTSGALSEPMCSEGVDPLAAGTSSSQ